MPDCWQSSTDSGVIGDAAVFIQGDIEIHPHEDLSIPGIKLIQTQLRHLIASVYWFLSSVALRW
jgi:hypothetical protein